MQSLRYYLPPQPLFDRVGVLFVARSADASVFPIGTMLPQLNFVLSGRLTYSLPGVDLPAGTAMAIGAMSRAATVVVAPGTVMLGAHLLPLGWLQLLRLSAHELTDNGCALADLGLPWESMATLPPDTPDGVLTDHLIATLGRALEAADPPALPQLRERVALLDTWVARDGRDVTALTSALGISNRQLNRLTRATYGLSPDVLVRKSRIVAAAAHMSAAPRRDWLDVAGDRYTDQSHFIREFKRFIGKAPGAFVRELQARESLVLRERWIVREEDGLTRVI